MAGWYLSQAFAPDNPGTQVFLAPGPDDQLLATDPSPWIVGRLVRVPGRFWHRLLIAINERTPDAANILDKWSGSADPNDSGEQSPDPEEVAAVRGAVRGVTARLRSGKVVTDKELDALGSYTREDIAAMADAVMRVVDEAINARAPFSAWSE